MNRLGFLPVDHISGPWSVFFLFPIVLTGRVVLFGREDGGFDANFLFFSATSNKLAPAVLPSPTGRGRIFNSGRFLRRDVRRPGRSFGLVGFP
jgi:hypothetical protein